MPPRHALCLALLAGLAACSMADGDTQTKNEAEFKWGGGFVRRKTVCETRLGGQCIPQYYNCPSGYIQTTSYCGFMQFCCYKQRPRPQQKPTKPSAYDNNPERCGVSMVKSYDSFLKVVGGTEATPHEFPWQVSLQNINQYARVPGHWQPVRLAPHHTCGGTIIHREWVVTAAHCFMGTTDPQKWAVVIGSHEWQRNPQSHYIGVKGIYIHAGFPLREHQRDMNLPKEQQRPIPMNDDIALMHLDRPVDISGRDVRATCLDDGGVDLRDHMCTISGWGKRGHDDEYRKFKTSRFLQKANLPVISNAHCRWLEDDEEVYRAFRFHMVGDGMICAGYRGGERNAGQGDSGGPLNCKVNGVWQLTGITSWGKPKTPAVFTRVSAYRAWINRAKGWAKYEKPGQKYLRFVD